MVVGLFPAFLLLGLVFVQFGTAEEHVHIVTDKTYNQVVDGSKHVFLKVYAPWCGHCKALAEPWEALAKVFTDEKDVVIAKLDATKETVTAQKLGVKGYPTLLFFKKGETDPASYTGSRGVQDMIDYVNKESSTFRLIDGGLNHLYGVSEDLTEFFKKASCSEGNPAACFSQLKSVWESYTVPKKTESDSFLQKCHNYYKQLLTKLEADASFAANELKRLKDLYASSSVSSSAKQFIFARMNIIKSLQPIIAEKLGAAKESIEQEL